MVQHTLFKLLELAEEGWAGGTESVLLICSFKEREPGETSIRCLSANPSAHSRRSWDDAHMKDHTGPDEVHAARVHEAGGQEVEASSSQ